MPTAKKSAIIEAHVKYKNKLISPNAKPEFAYFEKKEISDLLKKVKVRDGEGVLVQYILLKDGSVSVAMYKHKKVPPFTDPIPLNDEPQQIADFVASPEDGIYSGIPCPPKCKELK
jgi:hypothetical protein